MTVTAKEGKGLASINDPNGGGAVRKRPDAIDARPPGDQRERKRGEE